MTIFRSYFSKNNTLIDSVLANNSQNPVTEITYGTVNQQVSRFIFDIDFSQLHQRIQENNINPQTITKHTLHLTNTISNASEYIGKRSYSLDIERATSFKLDLFNVSEDWNEGSGYDFLFKDTVDSNRHASNWFYRKSNTPWTYNGGSYLSGVTNILGSQEFENGSEDIEIDVTDYINGRLHNQGITGLTGYTGTTYGLGIKFPDELEELETIYRQSVGFHTKNTHTFYEPYIETTIDNEIVDDRNYFYLNKDNNLYLYTNLGNNTEDITVNSVEIYDYNDELYDVISGNSITRVKKGVYKIVLNIDSDDYLDAVLFRDVWNLTINNKEKIYEDQFYLISDDNYYRFNSSNQINFDNYSFYFWGINQKENIVAGDIRKIRLTIKELYPDQNNFIPLDVEYRVYTTVGEKYEIDVIPFTSVNRTSKGYEIDLDTSWLIPQDYYLQLRMKDGTYYKNKESVRFSIVSNGIKKI